jgi:hypothetical protein
MAFDGSWLPLLGPKSGEKTVDFVRTARPEPGWQWMAAGDAISRHMPVFLRGGKKTKKRTSGLAVGDKSITMQHSKTARDLSVIGVSSMREIAGPRAECEVLPMIS